MSNLRLRMHEVQGGVINNKDLNKFYLTLSKRINTLKREDKEPPFIHTYVGKNLRKRQTITPVEYEERTSEILDINKTIMESLEIERVKRGLV